MFIKIGVYDFFSYTIPGIFYFFFGFDILSKLGLIQLQINIEETMTLLFYGIVLLILAYVLGILVYPISNRSWMKLFEPKDFQEQIVKEVLSLVPNYEIDLNPDQAYIYFTYYKKDQPELGTEIDRFKAVSIMLRNLSLSLFLLALSQTVQIFVYHFQPLNIIFAVLLFLASIIAGREGVNFNKWFFLFIYQATITESLSLSDLVKAKKRPKKKKEE